MGNSLKTLASCFRLPKHMGFFLNAQVILSLCFPFVTF